LLPAIVLAAGVLYLPYALGGLLDNEDLNSTVLTTKLFVEGVAQGQSPFWTPLLGLGLPQPFRISHAQHPLALLYLVLDPVIVVRIFVAAHLLVGALGMWVLARLYHLQAAIAFVAVLSFLACTTTGQYLYHDDWPSNLVTWSFLPVLLALTRLVLVSEGRAALTAGLALGLLAGFDIATGLFSYILTHAVIVAILLAVEWRAAARRLPALALAAVVALVIGAAVLLLLAGEWSLFSKDAARVQHEQPRLREQIWSTFLRPLWGLGLSRPPGSMAAGSRTIGFGTVFALLALVGLVWPRTTEAKRLALCLTLSILCLALPPGVFLGATTALWLFRDGVVLFGILLAGQVLKSIPRRLVLPALALQVLALALGVAPDWSKTLEKARAVMTGRAVGQDALVTPGPADAAIAAAMPHPEARVILAPVLYAERRTLRDIGIVDNALAFRGIAVVDTFARGIATSALSPDAGLMEGNVGSDAGMFRDRVALDVLGIGVVLARPGESVPNGLEAVSRLPAPGGDVEVLRNPGAWAPAVFVRPDVPSDLPLRAGCSHDRFLCRDMAGLADAREPGEIGVGKSHGRTVLTFAPSPQPRTILLTDWYRPAWRITEGAGELFPVAGQLIGIRVPPGESRVVLEYRPRTLAAAYLTGTVVLWAGILVLAGLVSAGSTRGRR
jgi:hypothetical protein